MPQLVLDIVSSSEFWAAIVGAVVGGFIAALTQWRFMKVQQEQLRLDRELQKKEREDERTQQKLERDRALATSLVFKLARLTEDLISISQHVEQCFARTAEIGPHTEPWQMLSPILNVPDAIRFSAEEMSLLLSQAHDQTFGQVLGLDHRHNGTIVAMKEYSLRREQVSERLYAAAIIDRAEGERVDMRYPEEAIRHLRPRMLELNAIVQHFRSDLPKDLQTAQRATNAAQTLLRKNLGISFKVQIDASKLATGI